MASSHFLRLSLALATLVAWGSTWALAYPEIPCPAGDIAKTNNQSRRCYNAGYLYQGYPRVGFYDDFYNSGTNKLLYAKEGVSYYQRTTQNGAVLIDDTLAFAYPSNLVWNRSKSGDLYLPFLAPSTTRVIASQAGELGFYGISNGSIFNASLPVYNITYVIPYHQVVNKVVGPVQYFEDSAYYYAAWCGDNAVDTRAREASYASDHEQCDRGAQNGQPDSGCSATCQFANTNNNGVCGSSNNLSNLPSAPTSNLCAVGTASAISGNGTATNPWSWRCLGVDGAASVSCSATSVNAPRNGSCGSTNGSTTTSGAPTSNLCSLGTASAISGIGTAANPWTWTCSGINGGSAATCSANGSAQRACIAGSTQGAQGTALTSASANLCPAGEIVVANSFTDTIVNGVHQYNWACSRLDGTNISSVDGDNGGNCSAFLGGNVSCQGLSVSPARGISGSNFTFTCTAANTGNNANFTLNITQNGNLVSTHAAQGGTGTWTLPLATIGAQASTVYAAQCLVNGTITSPACGAGNTAITATVDQAALCGSAQGVVTGNVPSANLCNLGTASSVVLGTTPPSRWTWSCTNGTSTTSCSAPYASGGGGGTTTGGGGAGSACPAQYIPGATKTYAYLPTISCIGAMPNNRKDYTDPKIGAYKTTWECGAWANGSARICQIGYDLPYVPSDTGSGTTTITNPPANSGGPNYQIFGGQPFPAGTTTIQDGIIIGEWNTMFESSSEFPRITGGKEGQIFSASITSGKHCLSQSSDISATLGKNGSISLAANWQGAGIATTSCDGLIRLSLDGGNISFVRFRVVKPAVIGNNGGNAFAQAPVGYNINTLVAGFYDNLAKNNFLSAAINTQHTDIARVLSSSTLRPDANASAITDDKQKEVKNLEISSRALAPQIACSTPVSADGLFLKKCISVASPFIMNGVTTIVSQEDIHIARDLSYANTDASWAWVAEDGNIIIDDTVENLGGVFIALCQNPKSQKALAGDCGRIISNGVKTTRQLIVEGALYGETSDLVDRRTYSRGTHTDNNLGNKALTVGTNIEWSDRALRHTPPKLQKFLDRYNVQRIAR